MKEIIKKIVLLIIVVVLVIGISVFIKKSDNKYKRPNYDYTATVYHSVMKGLNAGTEYFYYIYKSNNNDNTYFYIKSEATITNAGSGQAKDVYSGSIKNKGDLKKITNDIEKDSQRDAESSVAYTYLNSTGTEDCVDIDELGNKIFQ